MRACGGDKKSALVDTGALKLCTSYNFVKRLQLWPKQLSADEPEFLVAASGAKMPNIGTVEVDVFIQGLVIPFTFCLLNNLTCESTYAASRAVNELL